MVIHFLKILRFETLGFVLIVLLTKVITLCECKKGCRSGRFGANCELKCHCFSGTCDKDGNCKKCANGYFGQKCQYVNEAFFNAVPKTKYTDGEEKTCSSDTQETVFETVFENDRAIFLTWFRIIANNNAYLFNFTMTWNSYMTCSVNRKFIVDNRTVDGMCQVPISVHKVRIEGLVVGSLCEFMFTGGIYLSQSGTTSQTSDACPLCGSDKAVDGITAPESLNHRCAITKEETNPPSWILKFFQPLIIHTVVIYAKEKIFRDLYTDLTVKIITSTGIDSFLRRERDLRLLRFQILPQWHNTPVVKLSVTQLLNNQGSKKQLTICEIEVFGDIPCPKNTYGLNCTECNCSDTEICNPYTGGCGVACPVGFYGDNCTFLCNTNCLDDVCSFGNGTCLRCKPGFEGGWCINECKGHTYGQDCKDNCSELCIGYCNHLTGYCSSCGEHRLAPACIECVDGYYGEKCEMECSRFCLSKKCERQSGDCFECIGNRVGADCEDCEGAFYGLQCDHTCSRFCFNHTCNHLTGKCDACNKGYNGDYCNRGLRKPEFFVAVLSLFPIVFLIFFLVPNCHDVSAGDEDSTLT